MDPMPIMRLLWALVLLLFFRPVSCHRNVQCGLVFALPCTTFTNNVVVLLQKPVYPPKATDCGVSKHTPCEAALMHAKEFVHGTDMQHMHQVTCSCDDVHTLQRQLSVLQHDHRALTRKVLRLETIIADLVQTVQMSDDVALLERHTCSAVVYNEQLTAERPLRLLRHELKRLQGKYSL